MPTSTRESTTAGLRRNIRAARTITHAAGRKSLAA